MIESKFIFLQMQIEGSFVDPSESGETSFRKAPEAFNPVHMRSAAHTFILAMIDSEMFAVPTSTRQLYP